MQNIVLLKTAISIILVAVIVLVRYFKKENLLRNHNWVFLACRLIPYILIYFVLNYGIQSDVNAFYEQASSALQGKLVYKDFSSFHSPLFAYLIAIPLLVFHSGKGIILFLIALEYGTVLLLKYLVGDRKKFNVLASLYWLMPSSLIFMILGGQEDFFLFSFYALFMVSVKRAWHPFLSGFILFAGLFTTKIIFVLPLLGLAVLFWNNKKLIFSFVFFSVVFYALVFLLVGKAILLPYSEAGSFTPPNIWYLLNPIIQFNAAAISRLTVASLLGIILFTGMLGHYFKQKDKVEAVCMMYIVSFLLFYMVSPKSMGNYFGIVLIPLVFMGYAIKPVWMATLLVSILSAVHPTLWWRIGMPFYTSFKTIATSTEYIIDYSMVLVIIISGYYSILHLLKKSRVATQPVTTQYKVKAYTE